MRQRPEIMTDDLTVLLVEDNPGDARLIREMLRDQAELPDRADASGDGGLVVHREARLADALDVLGVDAEGEATEKVAGASGEAFESTAEGGDAQPQAGDDASAPEELDVDVVLLDLNLPDSTGLDTLATVVDATPPLPVIVLTGVTDREVGIEAIERGAQDYLVKDEVTSDLLVRAMHYALERSRQERERRRRREQLEALNRHNRIAQDVTHAVITSSTREELERAVCERLAASDGYRFAWIGEVNRGRSRVTPRIAAGVGEDYLEEISIEVGEDAPEGPTASAVDTHDVQVVDDLLADPDYVPWRDAARERGYRSSAAVPIVHEGLLYGVLNVYAGSTGAFSDPEIEIFQRLGDVVGHAISALERKDALTSDTLLELEFRVDGQAEHLVTAIPDDATVAFDTLIEADGSVLAYGEIEGMDREAFEAAVEEDDDLAAVRVLRGGESTYEVEVETSIGRDLFEALPAHGGVIDSASVTSGGLDLVVQFPQGRDTRRLIELVEEHCENASLQAQRTREREAEDGPERQTLYQERLTEKQRTALETAFHAGHFEWPRETSGEELAERLGVSPATFHEHLRSAERKVFEQVFESQE